MKCVRCGSDHTIKDGNHDGYQRYKCMDCKKRFDRGVYLEEYFFHFNIKLHKTKYNKLTRENYCEPTNQISYKCKKNLLFAIEYLNYKIPNKIYLDINTYTDYYVNEHYKNCMENYDLNIDYFNCLDYKKFDKYLSSFVRKNNFKAIDDLKTVNEVNGAYIIVLDEYKQVYIGISNNIKKRILTHWSTKKEFDRLLNGDVDKSVLSIDSFGALDTTRIYVKPLKSIYVMDNLEAKYVSKFKSIYTLNRVAGGLNAEESNVIRNLKLFSTIKKRKLK